MGRKIWLALAVAVIVAVSFAGGAVAAKHKTASDPRPRTVTKGLDYFHARQKADGGFGSMQATAWVILGAVASGERIGSTPWTVGAKNPFGYLQAHSHAAAATGPDVDNAPVYYARAIMSYIAADRAGRVFAAGTPSIDLLTKLYSYQDWKAGSPPTGTGSFSPSTSTRTFQAVHTTAWAILAMHQLPLDEEGESRFALAEEWLAAQQRTDGGFPAQHDDPSNCEDTAVAIQALELAPHGAPYQAVIDAARTYLQNNQRADGGFRYSTSRTATDAWATAAAIQAILAMGERPDSPDWKVGSNTPKSALAALQKKNGAYQKKRGDDTGPLSTTCWTLVALRDKPFTTFPRRRPPALKAFVFRPQMTSVSPKNGQKYTTTHSVLIRATYTDGARGTGVNPKACRVYVDDVNKTGPAAIGHYSLHLQLKNVAAGQHTYKLHIVDHAGNVRKVERRFTIATPTPPPTSAPTYAPNPTYRPPATIYPAPTPTSTATPYPTLTPTAFPSTGTPTPYQSGGYPVTGMPVASPSPSNSPGAASSDSGSAAGFLGGTLLAMLPIGAAISYLALRHREQALSAAGEGKVLSGGGSAWDRLKGALGKSKDLVKPAGR